MSLRGLDGGAGVGTFAAGGTMGRGGGGGIGPNAGKGWAFFFGGGSAAPVSRRAPEALASRRVEASDEDTRGRLIF